MKYRHDRPGEFIGICQSSRLRRLYGPPRLLTRHRGALSMGATTLSGPRGGCMDVVLENQQALATWKGSPFVLSWHADDPLPYREVRRFDSAASMPAQAWIESGLPE